MSVKASQWSDLPRRLATISIGVPILWIIWSSDEWRVLFFYGTHLAMCWEWLNLSGCHWSFLLLSLGLSLVADEFFVAAFTSTIALLSIMTAAMPLSQTKAEAFTTGLIFICLPFRSWNNLAESSFRDTVSLLLTVWNCDTGALVVGRLTKSAGWQVSPLWLQRISPSKSVGGLVGGLLFGAMTFWSLPWFWQLMENLQWTTIAVSLPVESQSSLMRLQTGALLSLAAILGDSWESTIKRRYGVKDSGKLLPGHGGVLDRFDSSLIAVMIFPLLLGR
ncbi:phosphatidate cytidylyltransferase [Fistulifera solaris]|uniref:Phosphatidate cytidylyltransferase n=1 Tax=Fistulifera solaris TaxID=1519565 RepID=A0A1Z5KED8_FISSO|nr:phosphatidate cytidylyltransferase [Fistulifera solaris]|eukprot:GAX24587.1 phosphatidate cytidylyltransferase [Fistulifera solaris]